MSKAVHIESRESSVMVMCVCRNCNMLSIVVEAVGPDINGHCLDQ